MNAGRVVRALRLRGTAPVIDGALGDEAWTAADAASGFVQRDPDNGTPMVEDTRIQIAAPRRDRPHAARHMGLHS